MSIIAQGQITITDLNDGENGKSYILNILNGVRSIAYDSGGKNPSPTQTAFSCELYEDGVLKTPSSYSWSASGLLSGTSTSSTFTPTCATTFSNTNNSISLTVVYNGQTVKSIIPISVTKLGANGNNAIIAVLSNETHTIPTDNAGNNGNYSGANTTMYIYNGAADDSANWAVSATSNGVTGTLSGKTYTVTAMSSDTGYVDLTASRSGYTSITRRFTLTKVKQGANGSNGAAGQNATAYKLISNVAAIAKNINNAYTPSTITISATSATGTAAPVAYAGRFIISETTDGSSFVAKYTSSTNESSKVYTPSANIKAINAKLYLAGGTSTLLDEQTIPIVSDGATGGKGDKGDAGTPAKYVIVNGEQLFKYTNNFSGTPTPSTINLSATLVGTSGCQWSYKTPGSSTLNNISGATSLTYDITHNDSIWGSHKQLTFRCTSEGVYDEITIAKISDGTNGTNGSNGINGKDAYTVILSNESNTFPGSTTAALASSTKCEVIAYKGATRVSATIGTITGLPTGMTAPITNNGTTTTYFSPTVTTSMTTRGGVLTVPITVDGNVFTKNFTYSLALKGDTGSSGVSITNVDVEYAVNTSSTTAPTTGWSTTTPPWVDGQYVWSRTKTTYSAGSPTYTNPACITGGKGQTGAAGSNGADGKGIKSTAITYQASTSGTTTPSGTWTSTIPTVSAGQFLWTRTIITYTDNTTSTSYAIGKMGEQGATGNAGKGVSSTAITYQASSSGTTTPTGTWLSTVPTVSAGQYLWTRTVITYTDGTTSTSYSIGKMGEQGPIGATGSPGKGIVSITELYKILDTKTQQPTPTSDTGWSTTPPTWTTGKYIHTCSKIVYQNPTSTTYTVPVCDSSWEAVNEIQIGGRNLLINSKVNIVNSSTYNIAIVYFGTSKPTEGQQCTISIKGELNAAKTSFGIYNSGGTISVATLTHADKGADGIYRKTFNWRISTAANTHIAIYALTSAQTGASSIEWVKMEAGNKSTDWTPSPEDVDSAITTAQSSANDANSKISDMASDSKLTPVEKIATKKEWDIIVAEKPTNNQMAVANSVSTTAYDNAYNTLNTYITPILSNMTTTTSIVRTTFQTNFSNYYAEKIKLLKAVQDKLSSKIDTVDQNKVNNNQDAIFNKLFANGTQGFVLENGKVYINGEVIKANAISGTAIKAGTLTADKLIIGIGEGGGLSANPSFTKWSGTYPDGTAAWSSGGISKQTVDGRTVAQFYCPTLGGQYGMSLSSSFFANGVNLDSVEFIALEVKFRLTSGTNPSGAAFLFDMYNTDNTNQRLQLNMTEAGSTVTTNTWYTVRKVFKITDANLAKTFKTCNGYLLANWNGSGDAVKTIQFATANVYIATEQDYLTQTWTINSTEINGGNIKAGTLSADKITTGILRAQTGSSSINLNDGTMLLGATTNSNYLQWTGSALNIGGTVNATAGKVATFTINGSNLIGTNVGMSGTSGTNMAFWAGGNTASSAPFRVSHTGALTCTSANIAGTVTATAGKIAGYTISGNQLLGTNVGMSGSSGTNWAFWAGSNTSSSAPFKVGHDGSLTATNATITGTINATSGTFSGNITSSATIEGGTIRGARIESSYHIRGDYPPDPPDAEGPVGYSYVKKLLLEDNNTRAMNDVNDYSYSVSLSGANFKSSVYKTYMGDPSLGYFYDTLDIWGSNMTMVSGYSPGNAQDEVLVISPSAIKMQDSQGNYPINVNTHDAIAGRSAVTMELGLTVYNDLILNNYLTLNAWPGYGSGTASLWYNGNTKALTMHSDVQDIMVGGKYVYRDGRYPGKLWIEGTNTISSSSNDTTSNWGAQNNSIHFFTTTGCLKNQPSQWGYLLNIGQGAEVHQIWMTQADGDMLHRGGNGSGWHGSTTGAGTWKTILDSSNYTNYAIPKTASCNRNWNWSGQGGQPTWVWGGNGDGTNMYVYNPANFSVSWATGAHYSNEWRSTGNGTSYIATGNGDNATWSTHNVIFKSHWGIGFRDYSDTCNFLIDTRTGNVFAKGYVMASSWQTSSDRRLKENITPIDKRLESMFMELKPVNYYMIEETDKRKHNGFIAQEVEEAMYNNNISYEEFAGLLKRKNENANKEDIPVQILSDETDEENMEYSLNYNEFTVLNTHMIQKCLNKIEELEKQIKELQSY